MKIVRTALLATATVALLAGCAAAKAASPERPSGNAPQAAQAPAQAPEGGPAVNRPQPAPCQARRLAAIDRGTSAAAGTIGLTVGLRNTGSTLCAVSGRPGITLLRDGAELPTNAVPDSSEPTPTVLLRPGKEAIFTILWTNPGMEPDPEACQPEATQLRIVPAGQRGRLTLAARVNACDGDLRITAPQPRS